MSIHQSNYRSTYPSIHPYVYLSFYGPITIYLANLPIPDPPITLSPSLCFSRFQIALHNRPLRTNDLLYRMVGATVSLHAAAGSPADKAARQRERESAEFEGAQRGVVVSPLSATSAREARVGGERPPVLRSVRVGVAREMYVWTLQPPVEHVSFLTVRLSETALPPGTVST